MALVVQAIKTKKPLPVGFFNAGTQVVTASSVDMGNNLPKITFAQLQTISASPDATVEFYKPWTKTVAGAAALNGMQPFSAESQ